MPPRPRVRGAQCQVDPDRCLRLTESLEGDQGEGVLHAGKGLDLAGDEVTDIGLFVELAFHEKVVLAGGRIDLRHLLDIASIVGHVIGLAELALHHDEDGLHDPLLSRGPV
jgi:hypothetical protein